MNEQDVYTYLDSGEFDDMVRRRYTENEAVMGEVKYNDLKSVVAEATEQSMLGGPPSQPFRCIGEKERCVVAFLLTYLLSQEFDDIVRREYNGDETAMSTIGYGDFKTMALNGAKQMTIHKE